MAHDNLAEHLAEVGRHREVASFVTALHRQTGPLAVDVAALDATTDDHHRVPMAVNAMMVIGGGVKGGHVTTDDHHRVPMAVIGAAVAVFVHGAPELRHRENDRVFHPVAE